MNACLIIDLSPGCVLFDQRERIPSAAQRKRPLKRALWGMRCRGVWGRVGSHVNIPEGMLRERSVIPPLTSWDRARETAAVESHLQVGAAVDATSELGDSMWLPFVPFDGRWCGVHDRASRARWEKKSWPTTTPPSDKRTTGQPACALVWLFSRACETGEAAELRRPPRPQCWGNRPGLGARRRTPGGAKLQAAMPRPFLTSPGPLPRQEPP